LISFAIHVTRLNDTKCHELRLVECGVKLESVLVYSFDGVADGLIFERGATRKEGPRGIKMVPPSLGGMLEYESLKQSDRRPDHRLEFKGAAIDHLAGDVEDDCQADIGDPPVLLQQPRNHVGSDSHQPD